MSIDPKLLLSNFPVITGALGLLIGGKTILVALVGRLFGVSVISAIRTGLLLAPGGEFAFVAFGEAVNQVCFQPHTVFLIPNGISIYLQLIMIFFFLNCGLLIQHGTKCLTASPLESQMPVLDMA